jgi:lysophospholipase L1-like esterase
MVSTVLAILLVGSIVLFAFTRLAVETISRHHYEQKSDFYSHYPIHPGDIVFMGDSITDGARWHELFPDLPMKNRGINGDTVSGVFRRIGITLEGKPAAIFILIGTNDLPWFMFDNDEKILKTYAAILQRCKEQSPETKVFIQSILPRHHRYAKRIQAINAHLKLFAESCGCTFIDLFPHLSDSDGGLLDHLTNDHLHLMAQGYAIWVEILTPYLEGFRQRPAVE